VPWLESILRLLLVELEDAEPGADAVVTRLTDVLIAQTVRGALGAAGRNGAALPSAASDPPIVQALGLLHAEPSAPWTVSELARRVALSPSALGPRFQRLTGETPMRYLTRYRLAQVATQLRASNTTVDELAAYIGYSSSVALSKAFKRYFGQSPGAYRRGQAP
jgi:AraC-like DNA-binding protein